MKKNSFEILSELILELRELKMAIEDKLHICSDETDYQRALAGTALTPPVPTLEDLKIVAKCCVCGKKNINTSVLKDNILIGTHEDCLKKLK